MSLLEVNQLGIAYDDNAVLDQVSFAIDKGESVGLVGASGAGKSQTALAIMGLLPGTASTTGSILFAGTDLLGADSRTLNGLRSRRLSMVFQDPALALNPYLTIGRQLDAILEAHGLAAGKAARGRTVAALDRVGLPDPGRQYRRYPHELSGGMRQRAMLAAALLGEPELLIADEPTTALDVTVQAQVLDLLDRVRDDTALLLITHDLGIVAGHCDRLVVLDRGQVVEAGETTTLFRAPLHATTRALLDAAPALDQAPPEPVETDGLLDADAIQVTYRSPGRPALRAVREVSLVLNAGETLAIVGESGSGKTSLARAVLGVAPADQGRIVFAGSTLAAALDRRSRTTRRALQLVFQDPAGSLSPTMTVREILGEGLDVHEPRLSTDARAAVLERALDSVELPAEFLDRLPHELSGGQAQRVAIARALVLEPRVLVCDEALAALDGGVRQTVLDVLRRAQAESGLSILFIAHDLALVQGLAHRVAVMYLGSVVESGTTAQVFDSPEHPYTRALLDAVPLPNPDAPGGKATLTGDVPSPHEPPSGCHFRTRCAYAEARCAVDKPALSPGRANQVACVRASELSL